MRKIVIFRDGVLCEFLKGEAEFVVPNAMAKVNEGGVARRIDRTSLPQNIEITRDPRLPKTLEAFDEACPEGADWHN